MHQPRRSSPSTRDNFFFQAEDGIRDRNVTGVQTCALPIYRQSKDVSDDWRFAIAYNAALQAATAALAAAGYRASRENHHYRVIQSLELTLGKDRSEERRVGKKRRYQ